jgi:hypothetical protein
MSGDFSPLVRAEVCPAGGVRLDRESSLPSAQFHLAYISKDGMLLPVILLVDSALRW